MSAGLQAPAELGAVQRVFVVEDHPLMQQTLTECISAMPDAEVSGSAATGEDALEQLLDAKADLALVDMSLPKMSGADLILRLQTQCPQLLCLVLSGHREPGYVERALAAGARGYVLKGNPYELAEAIRMVLRGQIYLSKPLRGQGNGG